MKTVKQLLRQPLKSLMGVLLMTLAVAVLCICLGQALAAYSTRKDLDERFSTVGVPSLRESDEAEYLWDEATQTIIHNPNYVDPYHIDEELLAWIEEMTEQYPDMVKSIAQNGLLSAYIPELLPYNTQAAANVSEHLSTRNPVYSSKGQYLGDTHYDSAMLVITLESISDPTGPGEAFPVQLPPCLTAEEFESQIGLVLYDSDASKIAYQAYKIYYLDYLGDVYDKTYDEYFYEQYLPAEYRIFTELYDEAASTAQSQGASPDADGYSVRLTGTITEAVSLPDGMRDPTGMTANITLTLPTAAEIEALGLREGETYLVYGMNYLDVSQSVCARLHNRYNHISFDPVDTSLLTEPSVLQRYNYLTLNNQLVVAMYDSVPLQKWEYDALNTVSMTVTTPTCLADWEEAYDSQGNLTGYLPPTEYTYTAADGQGVAIPIAEYDSRYWLPTITPLTADTATFLSSDAGKQWQEALETDEVNNHGFAVVGVEKMAHLPAFSLELATIGAGREFTAEEIEDGAKVCIIHEWVAKNAGIAIGDTISLRFFAADPANPYDGDAVLARPAADLYGSTTPITEAAEYTIIGFWQGEVWPTLSKDYYCFSANTVFVPLSSVESPMKQIRSLCLTSVLLENGMMNDFYQLCRRSGYAGQLKLNDQGYGEIAGNFHNYETMARQVMVIGLVLYGILLLLYLLLYPASQRRTARTMESMGCGFGRRLSHILLHTMAIAAVASVLGMLLGGQLWGRVVATLQSSTASSLAVDLETRLLAVVAAGQLFLILLLGTAVAALVARSRGIADRR